MFLEPILRNLICSTQQKTTSIFTQLKYVNCHLYLFISQDESLTLRENIGLIVTSCLFEIVGHIWLDKAWIDVIHSADTRAWMIGLFNTGIDDMSIRTRYSASLHG